MEPVYEPIQGQYGKADPVHVPALPSAAETVCIWLVTAPGYHPLWSQYLMVVLRLRDDQPGFPPARHKFEGTTHELIVLALNPEAGEQTVERLDSLYASGSGPAYLLGPNVSEQFIATDEEMRGVAFLCVRAILQGLLNPDTDGRSAWLPAITKTLAHLRGELHSAT
jgi:hypothetical protein